MFKPKTQLIPLSILILFLIIFTHTVQGSIHLPPKLIKSPDDITYEMGTSGNVLIWQYEAHETADEPTTYNVTMNGTILISKASWQDNTDIVVDVDGFNIGIHIIQIIVSDTGVDTNQAQPAKNEAMVTVIEIGSANTTTTTTTTAASSGFPPLPLILLFLGTLVIFTQKRKEI